MSKGSKQRPTDKGKYDPNFDSINWHSKRQERIEIKAIREKQKQEG